jgi:hypothetical protein
MRACTVSGTTYGTIYICIYIYIVITISMYGTAVWGLIHEPIHMQARREITERIRQAYV